MEDISFFLYMQEMERRQQGQALAQAAQAQQPLAAQAAEEEEGD